MAKTSFIDKHFGTLVLLALVVGVAYYGSAQSWDLSKFNLINLGLNINVQGGGGNYTQPPPQTIYVDRTNLCNAYGPTIEELAAFYGVHPATACAAGGGTWMCDATHMGCYGYDLGMVDCANPVFIHMMAQCTAYGAYGFCDPFNAYCQYG